MSDPDAKRILIAEDVRTIALSLAGILRAEGYLVEVAGDGEQALAQIPEFQPHLLLLDLLMPKMHGIEVSRRLRELPGGGEIGVILSTTKEFNTEWRRAQELGAIGRIQKPTTRAELLAAVGRFFEGGPTPPQSPPAKQTTKAFSPVLATGRGGVRMWGTRGSIPVSGSKYHRYGGNTMCMEFDRGGDEDVIIFDAGSGIRELGERLAGSDKPRPVHLFITHTHWDHIQGFPFFQPLHNPDSKITIYGSKGFGDNLESVLRGQFAGDYFPVQWRDFRASVEFVQLEDEPVTLGEATVSRCFVNHPGATVGYKIEYRDRATVFIPDNEFLQGYLGRPDQTENYHDLLVTQLMLINFVKGADLLVHEAQFTNEEYAGKIGWGHSSVSNACALVAKTRVKEWLVTHHDPSHDDEFLGHKLALEQQLLSEMNCPTRVSHAHDGLIKWL